MTFSTKPGRPFGVSLAILVSVILYTVIPVLIAGLVLYLNEFLYTGEDNSLGGIRLSNFSVTPMLILVGAGVLFFVIAIWCWRGRRPITRFVFQGMIVLYTGVLAFSLYTPARRFPAPVSSGDVVQDTANTVYLWVAAILLVYVLWFMNRWSARAFYRGYYTAHDLELLDAAGMLPDKSKSSERRAVTV